MKNNKTYKIVIAVLCVLLVCVQIVCFSLGVTFEINAIIDVVAIIISFIFVTFLNVKGDTKELKEDIKEDLKEGVLEISNKISNKNNENNKKE